MKLQSSSTALQPTLSRRRVLASLTLAALIAISLLVALVRAAGAQTQPPLAPNAPAAGNLTSRFGDAWLLYGCAGDTLTVTVTSTAFTPYLELYGAGQELPIVEAGGEGEVSVLAGAPLAETGFYTVAVLGDRLSARGPYTVAATLVATTTALPAESTTVPELPDFYVAANQSVTGTVASRFGDLWQMHVCAGAPVTVTLYTTSFAPVLDFAAELSGTLSLMTPTDSDSDSSAASDLLSSALAPTTGEPPLWTAAVFTPSHTIDLQVTVGGERRSDRGPYTLLVETAPTTVTVDATGAAVATTGAPAAPPPRQSAATATATRTAPQAAAPSCRVLVDSLRLRSGPGTAYEPPLGALPQNTALDIVGRSADSGWLSVRVQGSSLSGWVSAGTQFVQCNVTISGLPVITAPPTSTPLPTNTAQPTSTPTNTPLPIPTPTPPAYVIVPGTGTGGNVPGNLRTGENVAPVENGVMRFSNQLWFFADVEKPDGRSIDRVEFIIFGDNQPDTVHTQSEGTRLYCVFGGGEPNCNVLNLGSDARWPSTGLPVLNDSYQVTTRIYLDGDDDDNPSGSWFASFRIQSPNLQNAVEEEVAPVEPPPAPEEVPDIQVELREVGPGSGELATFGTIVFQVAAWDPAVGNNNGDGIESIDLAIQDENGNVVYQRTERTAAYCAFAGGEPDCNIYDYAGNGYVWEGGAPVVPGPYWLTASVHANDGRVVSYRWDIDVQ